MGGWAFAVITFFECLCSSMGKRVKTVRIDGGLLATTVLRRSFGVHGRKQKKMWKSRDGTKGSHLHGPEIDFFLSQYNSTRTP